MSFSTFSSNRYTVTVILMAAVLFGGFVAASHVIVNHFVAPVDQRLKKLQLEEASSGKDAVFGDSRLNYGFASSDDFVNLAFDGDSIADMVAKVDHFLSAGHPDRIVLQASSNMFAGYRLAEPAEAFFQDYGHGVLSEYHRVRLFHYWRIVLSGAHFTPKGQLQPTGWKKVEDDWSMVRRDARLKEARERIELQTPVESFAREPDAREYENLVKRLTAAGITTCLVRPPVSREYLTFARQNPLWAEVDSFFAALARRHGARYVNLGDAFAGEGQTALFADADHLNAKGAPLATRLIREKCFPDDTFQDVRLQGRAGGRGVRHGARVDRGREHLDDHRHG